MFYCVRYSMILTAICFGSQPQQVRKGTIPILRQHIFGLFLTHSTHSPCVNINNTQRQQKLPFFLPYPRSSFADVRKEWSPKPAYLHNSCWWYEKCKKYFVSNFVVLYFEVCKGKKILVSWNFSTQKSAELLKQTMYYTKPDLKFGVLGFVLLKVFTCNKNQKM